MSFDDDNDDKKSKRKIGLKLDNKKSTVLPSPKIAQAAAFDEKVTKEVVKMEDFKKRTWDLSVQYRSFIEDSTLKENKGPIAENLEKENLENLIELAVEMNSDENQPEGMGSVALNMLLMKCMLIQRNTINSLGYELDKIKKQLFEFQKSKTENK